MQMYDKGKDLPWKYEVSWLKQDIKAGRDSLQYCFIYFCMQTFEEGPLLAFLIF